ncbi:MAG: hypothetical protein H6740_23355 [Alphaproteobacteria bacterium]|nr:hypothetical protein [Alphaproteobacteria bacterium]
MLLLLACAPPVLDSAQDSDPQPFTSTLPSGGCGLPEHAWLPAAEMGEILDWEALDAFDFPAAGINSLLDGAGLEALTPVPYGVKVFRVRYRSQDKGQAIEATALLSFPDAEVEATPLLWEHGTTGMNDACAPSASGLEGAAFNIILSSLGFAVAAPDYLGMNGFGEPSGMLHPWLEAESTAVLSLDALRAMYRWVEVEGRRVDATLGPQAVFWGGSEGGFAALWSDRFLQGYAPELPLAATVAAIPATDLKGIAELALAEPSDATGALAVALATQNPWYGEPAPLDEVLLPELAAAIGPAMAEECRPDLLDDAEGAEDIFQPGFIEAAVSGDWDSVEPWSCMLDKSGLVASPAPRDHGTPVLIVTSELDRLALPQPVHEDIPRLCDQGYSIEHVQCAGADHVSGAALSLRYQLDWIQGRLDGEALEGTCVVSPPVDCEAL